MSKIKICLFTLLMFLLMFGALEIIARAVPQLNPVWLRNRQMGAAIQLQWMPLRQIYPGIGPIMRPNKNITVDAYPEFTYHIHTGQLGKLSIGFRDNLPFTPNPWAIILGDSFCEGTGVEIQDLWSKKLENKTGQRILNLGQSGTCLDHYKLMLKNAAQEVKPKYIFIMFYFNDYDYFNAMESNFDSKPTTKDALREKIKYLSVWLLKNSFTYRLLRAPDIYIKEKRQEANKPKSTYDIHSVNEEFKGENLDIRLDIELSNKTNQAVTYYQEYPQWPEAVARTRENLKEMLEIAHQMGSQVALIYAPYKTSVYLHLLSGKYPISPDYDMPERTIQQLCDELSIPMLSLTPALRHHAVHGEQVFWKTDVHWTVSGNAIVSDTIYDWIKNNHWL